MLLTVRQSENQACPFGMQTELACLVYECMAWRWAEPRVTENKTIFEDEDVDNPEMAGKESEPEEPTSSSHLRSVKKKVRTIPVGAKTDDERLGYCGLVGKPEIPE